MRGNASKTCTMKAVAITGATRLTSGRLNSAAIMTPQEYAETKTVARRSGRRSIEPSKRDHLEILPPQKEEK
jgi:hypothetical protein